MSTNVLSKAFIDYVKDVKPFHTKISSVQGQFIFNEEISVKVKDSNNDVVFLGADLFPLNRTASILRNESKSWVKSLTSDGKRSVWSIPMVSFNKTYKVSANSSLKQLSAILPFPLYDVTNYDSYKLDSVYFGNAALQDTIDFVHSQGIYSFVVYPDQKWKTLNTSANTAKTNRIIRNPGKLIYEHLKYPHIIFSNLENGNFDEWTITCIDQTTQTFLVKGKYSGEVGTFIRGQHFSSPQIAFDTSVGYDAGPALLYTEIILTPHGKIVIDPTAPLETWTLVRTNPANIKTKPVFSENTTVTRLKKPDLIINTFNCHNNSDNAAWTISFIDTKNYSITRFKNGNLDYITAATITDGCTFSNDDISFTLKPCKEGFFAGDTFIFEQNNDYTNYKVFGSISGFQPDAKIGEWYWNGKIGFKVPKLHSFAEIKKGNTVIQSWDINAVIHPNTEPSQYEIKFLSGTTATVYNHKTGFKSSLSLESVWKDDYVSFIIPSSLGTFAAGDSIKLSLVYTKKFYIEQPGEHRFVTGIRYFLDEYFPFEYGRGAILPLSNYSDLTINKNALDSLGLYINNSSTLFTELSPVNNWIPLVFKTIDNASDSPALNNDFVIKAEAYLAADKSVKVFTLSIPRYKNKLFNQECQVTFTDAFRDTYLKFNTQFKIVSLQSKTFNDKITVKLTETFAINERIKKKIYETMSVKISDHLDKLFIDKTKKVTDNVNIQIDEGGGLPFMDSYDVLPYDTNLYNAKFVGFSHDLTGIKELLNGDYEWTGNPTDKVERNLMLQGIGISVEQDESDKDITSTVISESISISLTSADSKTVILQYENGGIILNEIADKYIINHTLADSTPNIIVESLSNPGVFDNPVGSLPTDFGYTNLHAISFTLSHGFTLPVKVILA